MWCQILLTWIRSKQPMADQQSKEREGEMIREIKTVNDAENEWLKRRNEKRITYREERGYCERGVIPVVFETVGHFSSSTCFNSFPFSENVSGFASVWHDGSSSLCSSLCRSFIMPSVCHVCQPAVSFPSLLSILQPFSLSVVPTSFFLFLPSFNLHALISISLFHLFLYDLPHLPPPTLCSIPHPPFSTSCFFHSLSLTL